MATDNCRGKALKFKNCQNLATVCHAQSINFSSDFYLSNYECGFLFDFSSFDFLYRISYRSLRFVGRCGDVEAMVFLWGCRALA